MTNDRLTLALGSLLLLALAGCTSPVVGGGTDLRDGLPPAGADFDYQLGGGYDPAPGVTIVARDSTDKPAAGLYNICYVNGFQTQPGEGTGWLKDHPDAIVMSGGEPLIDENWPDEFILDTSNADKREQIVSVIGKVIKGCAANGFDAVEIDNLDSWTRSDNAMTIDDNIALAAAYATVAHDAGLAIAQKNSAEDSQRMRAEVGFDFAVTEECMRYTECGDYTKVYGDHVYDIEYPSDQGSVALDCGNGSPKSMILRDLELTTPSKPGYLRESCSG